MKPCEYFEERIDLLLDGMLTPSEEAELCAHLKICPACAARERELREMKEALGALDTEAPPELHARIMTAVAAAAAEKKPEKLPLWKRLPPRRVLSGVAACAVLALAVAAWDHGSKSSAEEPAANRGAEGAPAAEFFMEATPETADETADEAGKNMMTMMPETANDAISSGAEAVMTYAAVEAYEGELEPLREELEGAGCVRFSEEDAVWQAVFETGSQAEQDFRARLSELGLVSAAVPEELKQEPDVASPYTLFVLILK